jgi:hypothetical protein
LLYEHTNFFITAIMDDSHPEEQQQQDLELGQYSEAENESSGSSKLMDDTNPDGFADICSKTETSASRLDSISSNHNDQQAPPPPFPKAFYCPITEKVLVDPVVTPEGVSYERAALGDDIPTEKLYDNRALNSIIDETVEYKTSSALKRLQLSVLQFSQQLITIPGYHRPLSDGYYCPITLSLIHVPVIDPEGYSYEKTAIENWIRYNGASPVTRRALSIDELVPNKTLAALMEEEKTKSDELMHPAFKQWKEEPPALLLPVTAPGASAAGDAQGGSAGAGPTTTTFPITPEQLEEANRIRRIRRYQRCHIWTIAAIVLAVLAWIVPVVSTVLLVIILFGVAMVTACSSNNASFHQN